MTGASTRGGRPLALFGPTALLTVVLDQAAKALALAYLGPGAVAVLGGLIQFTLSRNSGSAFGLPTPAWAAIAVSLAVCVVVSVYVLRSGAAFPRVRRVALGLIVGGALGNLADRVSAGAVIDFIDFKIWPVFNIADIAITVGVAALMIEALRRK